MAEPEAMAGPAKSVFSTLVAENRIEEQKTLPEQANFEKIIVVNRAGYEEKGAGTSGDVKSINLFSRIRCVDLQSCFISAI